MKNLGRPVPTPTPHTSVDATNPGVSERYVAFPTTPSPRNVCTSCARHYNDEGACEQPKPMAPSPEFGQYHSPLVSDAQFLARDFAACTCGNPAHAWSNTDTDGWLLSPSAFASCR